MEAVVIDVSPDYFVSAEDGDDLRTEADFEDVSIMDDVTRVFSSPDQDSRSSLKRSARYSLEEDDKPPTRPPRKKSSSSSKSEKSEKSHKMESESFHSAQKDEPFSPVSPMSPVSSLKQDDSDTFADALSSARLSISENQVQRLYEDGRERKRSLSAEKTAGSSIDDGIGGDSSFDSVTGAPKKKKHRKKKHKREKGSSEESSIGSEIDGKRRKSGSAGANTEMLQRIESINKTEEPYVEDVADKSSEKKQTTSESDKSLSKSNKERLLDNMRKLKEPVFIVRDTLVSIDNLETKLNAGSEEECKMIVTKNIIKPIQNLCEEVSSIESKALKNAGDRSLNQTIRISLLEAIGGPTEELLRGMELIERQENVKNRKMDLIAILESLTDPVDEILMGITKLEHELTGRAKGERPIALIRMISAVSKLDENVRNVLTVDKRTTRLVANLQDIINTLDFFLNDVSVDPTKGTIETVDTVVVESLSKSIEDMARALSRFSTIEAKADGASNIAEELIPPTRELKAKLDTLKSALETYETRGILSEHRTKLIESLQESTEQTIVEIQRVKDKKPMEDQKRIVEEPKQDILKEVRLSLQETLKTYENIADTLDPRLCSIFNRIDEMYRRLRTPQRREIGLESLTSLEGPLYSLQCALTSISTAENSETISKLLEPAISQLKSTIINLNENSLQYILEMVNNIERIIYKTDSELEESTSSKSIQEQPHNLTDRVLDPLIDVQAALSTALQNIEDVESVTNGAASSQKLLASSEIAVCLVELRQYISDAVHTAMTLREDETINSLIDLKDPLLDLQTALVSKGRTFQELPVIRKMSIPVEKLKIVVSKALKHSISEEDINSIKDLWKMIEEIETQLPKTISQLVEAEEATKHILDSLNVDQNLSNVHFALSSALERQEKSYPNYTSCLTISVEDLRQSIGSSAVAIANLKNPVDEQIVEQVSLLKECLLSLQRSLLTQEHEPEEEQILKDLISPIEKLKRLVQTMVNTDARTDVILPVLELLEEIEKDTPLIAREASKKKAKREAEKLIPKKEEPKKQKVQSFGLADRISRSLYPMKHWLSNASEESTKDEEESALSSTVDELKKDVNKIAIETSYSEPPSDENLIEALADLREPLTRLRNAISMYHEPADLTTLEELGRPMKHLLQTIMDILKDHAGEETLQPIVDIVEEIENQIPISIKEALYRKELKEMVQSMTQEKMVEATTSQETIQEESIPQETILPEREEITAHVSQETIPEATLMESTTILLETQFTESIAEQTAVEESSQRTEQLITTIEELPKEKKDMKKAKKEEEAKSLVVSLFKTLESVQVDITGILEDFEEPTAGTTIVPVSILANSVEELMKTISEMRVTTGTYGTSVNSYEEIVSQTVSVLRNLLQPLNNLQKVLQQSHQHGAQELLILNHLIHPLNVIESEVINSAIEKLDQNSDLKKSCEPILNLLRDIKDTVPIVVKDIHSRQELLGSLREISKPLENIEEQMKILEAQADVTLETDVARILVKPLDYLLNTVNVTSQELELLDQRREIIVEFRTLVEPLVEFLSSLSVVQSSRKSLVPESALLDERRSVISKAVEGLQRQTSTILERISNLEGATLFEGALSSLKNATISVQQQIGGTDYSRRSSNEFTLQYNLSSSFNHLKNTIAVLDKNVDKSVHQVISKSLEALEKQITLSETHFMQTFTEQAVDEEAIVEGFLYPTNQLKSALNVLKEKINQRSISSVSVQTVTLLQALANSTTELASSLSLHRVRLIRERASEGSSLVETLSAMVDVLESVNDSIREIEMVANVEKIMTEEKEENISPDVPITITQIETIVDEIIEVSREEVESVLTIEKVPPEEEPLKIEEIKSEEKIQELQEQKTGKVKCPEPMKEETVDTFEVMKKEITKARETTEEGKIKVLQVMEKEKVEASEEVTEEKVELLEGTTEEKAKALEVTEEEKIKVQVMGKEKVETLEGVTEGKVELLEGTTEEKAKALEVTEEEKIKVQAMGKEKVETSEGVTEEKVELLEGTTEEKAKALEVTEEEEFKVLQVMGKEKVESLEGMTEGKVELLEGTTEEKAKALEVTEEEKIIVQAMGKEKVETFEGVTEEKVELLEGTIEEKAEALEVTEGEEIKIQVMGKEKVETLGGVAEGKVELLEGTRDEKAVALEVTDEGQVGTLQIIGTETLASPELVEEEVEVLKEMKEEAAMALVSPELVQESKIECIKVMKVGKVESVEGMEEEKAGDLEITKGEESVVIHKSTEELSKTEERVEVLSEETKEGAGQILFDMTEKLSIKEEKVETVPQMTEEMPEAAVKVEAPLDETEKLVEEAILTGEVALPVKTVDEKKTSSEKVAITEKLKGASDVEESMEEIVAQTIEPEQKKRRTETAVERMEEGKIEKEEVVSQVIKIEESKKSEELRQKHDAKEQVFEKVEETLKTERVVEESLEKTKEETRESAIKESNEVERQREIMEALEQIEDLAKAEEKAEEERKQEKINLIQKTGSLISALQQPFKELTSLVSVALDEPLSSRSEEEKRRIRELTALIQILYDLKATSASIQNTLSSSSISELKTQFIRLLESLINVDQATEKILRLTQKELAPALKENVMVSLQILSEPLKSLQRELSSIQGATSLLPTDCIPLRGNAQNVNEAISELVKVIQQTTETKSMKVVEEIKVMAKTKEENLDIEETTAKPLEELIEVLMVSQEQVKPEDTSPLGSAPPSVESAELTKQRKLEADIAKKIVSPIQNLREAIAKIEEEKFEETEQLDLPTKTAAIILSTIIYPLEKLKQSLDISSQQQAVEHEEITEETQSNVPPLHSLPVANILEELERSIATIQEEMILEANEEMSTSENKALIVKEIDKSLENLKFSIGAVQKIVTFETESAGTFSNIEETPAVETFIESVNELGEKCTAIVSSPPVKIECPEEIRKEELEQILEMMSQPIQLLRETASEIEEQKTDEVRALDETSKNVVEALKPLVHPLEELEQLLCTAIQQIRPSKDEKTEEIKSTTLPTEQLKVSPVLEELQKSIVMIEEQIAIQPKKLDVSTTKVEASVAELIESPLKTLKYAVTAIQTLEAKETKELTNEEKTTALKTLAKCVEKIANVSSVIPSQQKVEISILQQPQVAKIDIQEFGQQALDNIASPIQILRETISKLDEQQTQETGALIMSETKEIAGVLHTLVEPLEQLEKSFSVAVQETSIVKEESTSDLKNVQSSMKLNVGPVLEQLEKSIAVIQEQVSLEPTKEESKDKLVGSVAKTIEEPLEQLKSSVAAIKEIILETEQTDDLSDVNKTSVLKSFAKSVEEIGEKCLAVISQQQIGIQLVPKKVKESQVEILDMAVSPLQLFRETIMKIEEEKLQQVETLDSSKMAASESALKILIEPLQRLETSLSSTVQQAVSMELNKIEEISQVAPPLQKLDIQPIVEELQKCVASVQEQVKLQTVAEHSIEEASIMQATEKSLKDLNSSLAIIQSVVSTEPGVEETLSETEKVTALQHFAKSVQELEECMAMVSQHQVDATETVMESMEAEKLETQVLETIIVPIHTLRETIMKIQEESTEEIGTLELQEGNVQMLTPLMHPLQQLERSLVNVVQQASDQKLESVEQIQKETPQTIVLRPILQELKESIVNIQEQLATSLEESSKLETAKNINEALEEVETATIAVQQVITLSSEGTEEIKTQKKSALEAFAKSIEQLEEKCSAVISQKKVEKKLEEAEKQQAKMVDVEILQKISNTVHVLRESFSHIEEEKMQQMEELKIPKEETNVKLNVLIEPLNILEQTLQTALLEGKVLEEETTKELKKSEIPVDKLNLQPVLEELQKSIITIQQQTSETATISGEVSEVSMMLAAEKSLEQLKLSVAAVQEITIAQQDQTKELRTGEEKSRLEAFARSIEETGEKLLAAVKQYEVKKSEEVSAKNKVVEDFVKTVIEPINELQTTILNIDKESELLGKKKEEEIVLFLSMVQPLHKLEESFLLAMQQEAVTKYETVKEISQAIPALQELPVKLTLEELNKNVAEIQKQLVFAKETLSLAGDAEDFAVIKNLERSLSDLRTSVAVVQQLTTIEKPGEQILDVENASALQAFGKAVEEFRKQCSVAISKPKVIATIIGTIQLETPQKLEAQVSETVTVPAKLLQESISTIAEIRLQEAEILETSDTKKPMTILTELIPTLQRLEQCFVAAIQGEHVIEHDTKSLETDKVSLEKTTLKPILEEFQKSIAVIEEHMMVEEGTQSMLEAENSSQLKTMAQTLTDLKTSVAAIQQAAEFAPESSKEFSKAESVAAFETFAKTLHDLVERAATIDQQQIIIEPAADTISEEASSLKTWADVVEEANVQVTEPIIVDQGTVESPSEMALSISEEETQTLKSLAKPLSELKECLAIIVEERKSMDANEIALALSEREDISLLKAMAQPLLELKNVAVSVINEQTAIESTKEKSFDSGEKSETTLNPLIEPLEELRNSIALIEDRMLVESVEDRPIDEVSLLSALAEPLITLHRSISVLEERVMSPEVEPMPEESSHWITECLAVPLQEIERSIAEIRECVVMEPEPGLAEEISRIDTPDWSVVEKLVQPVEVIKSTIIEMEENIIKGMKAEKESEYEVVKTLVQPLADVQESFLVLKNKTDMSIEEEEASIDAIVDSLSNLEKSISFIEEQAAEKLQLASNITETIIGFLAEPLLQLKEKIMTVEESSTVYLENLEKPLKGLQATLEAVLSDQRKEVQKQKKESAISMEEATRISTKLIHSIKEVNDSIESIDNKIESYKGLLGLEIHIEKEALNMLAKPLEQLKQGIQSVLDKQEIGEEPMESLKMLRKAIAIVREQSADKPIAEPSHLEITEIYGVLKTLNISLHELEDSTKKVDALWKDSLCGEGLVELETPILNLMNDINLLRDKLLNVQVVWEEDKKKKKSKKKEKEEVEEEMKIVDKDEDERKKEDEVDKQKHREEEKKLEEEQQLREDEEKKKKGETEKLKQEEEERKKKEEAEKLKQEEEERKKKEEAEKLKQEEQERKNKEETEILKQKEDERKQKEAEKLQEEERKKQETELKKKREEDERKRKEEEERLKQEEEYRKKEEQERLIREEEDRRKKEQEEKLKHEEEARKKKEDAEKLKQDEERKKKEEAEKLKQEEERKEKEEAEKLKQKKERKKKEEAEKLKQEEERQKKEETEKLKLEEERKKKEEAERKKKEEAEKLKQEEDRKKNEEAEKLKQEEERKKKEEAEKSKLEEERKKKEEAEKLKQEEERKKKEEAEELKQEEERKKKEEAEKLKQEEERKKKEKAERKKKEEAEKLKQEEERQKKEEAEKLKQEEERKTKEEAEKLKQEEERKKKEEAEKLKQEEERKKKEEAEKLKQEEERKKKEESEKLKQEEERKKKEEAEKLKQEEERQKKEEAEKLKQEEERKKKEEAERKKKEEAEKLKQEEERQKKEEAEKLKQEEERKKKEEAERKKKEEAEKLKQEEERKKKEEAEKSKLEEERKKKEEAEKLKLEEERKKKEEAEKLRQEEERKKKEEAEKLKQEEERKKKEETEKLKLEEERKKKEEAEKLKVEEERKKIGEAEKLKQEEEHRKKEEAQKLKGEKKRKKKGETEKLKQEEGRKHQEAEQLKQEEEESKKKEAAEKLKQEQARKEQEETQKEGAQKLKEDKKRKKKEETEKLNQEEERKKKEEAEKLKQEEERKKKEAEKLKQDEDLKKEEEEKRRKEAQAEKLRQEKEQQEKEEAERKKQEEEARRKKVDEEEKIESEVLEQKEEKLSKRIEKRRLQQADDERKEQEEAEKRKKEQEQRKREREERAKKEEEERLKHEEEERKRKEERAKLKKEEEERRKAEKAEKLKRELEREDQRREEIRRRREEQEKQIRQEAEKVRKAEEERLRKEDETRERRRREREQRRQEEEAKLRREEEERLQREEERRRKRKEAERQWNEDKESMRRREIERLERRRAEERQNREESERSRREDEERRCRRETERQLRREEAAREMKEEEERVRRRQEEEASRLRRRRQEQLRDDTWSKIRQSESDQLFRKMADDALRIGRMKAGSSDVEFWRDRRDKSYRHDSGFDSGLSSTSRSYSWRDSLTSLTRKRIDDFLDYKLRDTPIDRYYYDTGTYYRRRRKRDDQITRTRSISLLKYDDYSTGDSDTTITAATVSKPPRYTSRTKTTSRIDLDDRGSNLSIYLPPIKDEVRI